MDALYDVWPWNIPPGTDFLWVFFLLSAAALVTALLLGALHARRLEAGAPPGIAPRRDPEAGTPYRTQAERRRLTIGSLPEQEDVWAVAYLRGGKPALVETLVAAAVAAGWVSSSDEDPVERPADILLADLHREIGGVQSRAWNVRACARVVAERRARRLEWVLDQAGLWRGARVRGVLASLVVAAGALAFAVGFVRCARASALHRPAGFLVLEMMALVVVTLLLARRQLRTKSGRARRFLAWLDRATTSVREAVRAGRHEEVEIVSSTVAIHGTQPVMTAPMFLAIVPVPDHSSASHAGSVFGCSSSSGGGGSSCGGGGASCGGGGASCGGGGGGCGGGGGGGGCGG